MPRKLNHERLFMELKQYLQSAGPSSASDICRHSGISQPVFSRLISRLNSDVLTTGKARSTLYTLRREIAGAGLSVPIYEIVESGKSARFGALHGVWPKGFYLEGNLADTKKPFFDGLPYFLEDLRPSGFLGRLIPKRHPELPVPSDIRLWSDDHCLQYLTRFGANGIGDFVIGDTAFQLHLASVSNPPDLVHADERPRAYTKMADEVLSFGPAGSSAGGEQPKFLATRGPERTPVIVKFSPPRRDEISVRLADLLVCEHIAHEILRKHGFAVARSAILEGGGRTFLEIKRFDRVGSIGRRGLISLGALAGQFARISDTWGETSKNLMRQKIIDQKTHTTIRALELFGRFIANTDMHMANLSFFTRGVAIQGLAPAYDILPMMYAPQHAQLIERPFDPLPPGPADSDIWQRAWSSANDFWKGVKSCDQVSKGFRAVARLNAEKIGVLKNIKSFLPT